MSGYEVSAGGEEPAPTLAHMRVRYSPGPLRESDVHASPVVEVRRWIDAAVDAGALEPNAMVLSTVADGPTGPRVSSRHVLLKELDEQGFVFYTNLTSRKADQLAANPSAALCFRWLEMSRQVCVEGRAAPLDRGTVEAYWRQRPRESQLGAWASDQSAVVDSRDALHAGLDRVERRFAEVEEVPVPPTWGGYRVTPERVELWQGQPGRLHDRLVYQRDGDGWVLRRLQP